MKKTLFLAAVLISTLAGVSNAGTPILIAEKEQSQPCLIGSLYGGWQSKYDWHGIVPSSLLLDDNSYFAGVKLMTAPKEGFSFLTSFSYRTVDSNNNFRNSLVLPEGNQTWAYRNLDIDDELSFFAGFNQELNKDWTLTAGYRLYHGGLAGLASDLQRGADGDSLDQMDHQAELRLEWNPDDSGFFFGVGGAYSFSGAEGWLLDATLGYEWDITKNISAVLSGSAYFSYDYWEVAGKSLNGSDGYQIKFSLPIEVVENLIISPYISCNFEGSNTEHTNSRAASYLGSGNMTRSYTTIVGAEVCWIF